MGPISMMRSRLGRHLALNFGGWTSQVSMASSSKITLSCLRQMSSKPTNLELLRADPVSRGVLDFLLDLPKSQFVFYGQIVRDIYENKTLQEDSGSAWQKIMERKSHKEINQLKVELESRMKELQAARESRLELESRLKAEAHDKQAVAIAEVTRLQAELRAMRDHMDTTVAKSVEAEKRTIQEKFLAELSERDQELRVLRESRLESESRLKAEGQERLAAASREVARLEAELKAERDHLDTTVAKAVESEKRLIRDDLSRSHDSVVTDLQALVKDLRNRNEALQEEKSQIWTKLNVSDGRVQDVLASLSEIKSHVTQIQPLPQTTASAHIGAAGEDFVLQGLRAAFPQNNRIFPTNSNHCGDIVFQVENTNVNIMFEVKDINSPVSSVRHGDDIKKFHKDAQSKKLGFAFDAAVLINLNSVVDPDRAEMEPFMKDGVPCLYVDNARERFGRDPVAFKAVISLMKAMVNMVNSDNQSFKVRVKEHMDDVKKMLKLYEKLSRSCKTTQGHLDDLKDQLESHLRKLQSYDS